MEQWCSLYCHLVRPTSLKPYRELSLFKQGSKPIWEDPLDDLGMVQQQLEQPSVIERCESEKTCTVLVLLFDQTARAY